MDERFGFVDADGYRHFVLPEFGSTASASAEQVNRVCDEWYVAEVGFIRRLTRRVSGSRGPDAEQYADAVTALAFFQAVRNGNGLARFVRDHLEGRTPIREPKGLFIRTIELHRSAAFRESQHEARTLQREIPTSFQDRESIVALERHQLREPSRYEYDESRIEERLRLRANLVMIATATNPTSASVERLLDALEGLCSEAVEQSAMIRSLTARQRLVFLLRVDPLTVVDATAVDYEHIASLCAILGKPATATALRQSLREALLRVRAQHAALKDDLAHG